MSRAAKILEAIGKGGSTMPPEYDTYLAFAKAEQLCFGHGIKALFSDSPKSNESHKVGDYLKKKKTGISQLIKTVVADLDKWISSKELEPQISSENLARIAIAAASEASNYHALVDVLNPSLSELGDHWTKSFKGKLDTHFLEKARKEI